MAHEAVQQPAKKSYCAVRFSYGDAFSSTALYTNWSKDAEISGVTGTFVSQPNMDISLPTVSGTLTEEELRLEMPIDDFLDRLTDGMPHSPCLVRVWRFTEADGVNSSLLQVFIGRVSHTVRNLNHRKERVQIRAANIKKRLNISLGIVTNLQCVWTLGGNYCHHGYTSDTDGNTISPGVEEADIVVTGRQIAAIDGKKVTMASSGGGAFVPSLYGEREFDRGYIELDGLRIGIRYWDGPVSGNRDFYLVDQPPSSWLNSIVTIGRGCLKTIEYCRSQWDNEANFGGFGYSMPSRHPLMETH